MRLTSKEQFVKAIGKWGMHNNMPFPDVPLHEAISIAAEALHQLRRGESSETILSNLDVNDEYLDKVLHRLWSETA